MMKVLSSLLLCLVFFSCEQPVKKETEIQEQKEQTDVKKTGAVMTNEYLDRSNYPYEQTDTGCYSDNNIHRETAKLWKSMLVTRDALLEQETTLQLEKYVSFNIKGSSINELYSTNGQLPDGLRVYFGLSDTASKHSPISDLITLFFVATYSCEDDYNNLYSVSHPNYILSQTHGEATTWADSNTAVTQISNWVDYVNSFGTSIVPSYAYNFMWSSITNTLPCSNEAEPAITFSVAMHTIEKPEVFGSTPDQSVHNGLKSKGYMVYDLLINAKRLPETGHDNNCKTFVDFANPCPQYCGKKNLINNILP